MSEGKHFDEGKTRWDLLPWDTVEGVAKVLTFGATKYGDHNWQSGIKIMRLLGSLCRHTFEWLMGRDIDNESGLHHLDHALCNLMMIRWMTMHKAEFVNRPNVEGI